MTNVLSESCVVIQGGGIVVPTGTDTIDSKVPLGELNRPIKKSDHNHA